MKSKKFKMFFDFYKYLYFLKKRECRNLIINLIIFVISIFSMINSLLKGFQLTSVFALMIFSASLFNVIWEVVGKLRDIKSFVGNDKEMQISTKKIIIKENLAFELKDIESIPRNNVAFENIKIDIGKNEYNYVMSCIKLNKYLWNSDIVLEIDSNKYEKVKKFILKNREIVAPFFQYKYYNSKKDNKYFFNDLKLCMANDIYPNEGTIRCYKSNYYNSFLTNEISMYVLKRIQDATIIYDASNFYPCEYKKSEKKYYLQSIDKSEMNNHIGASTLAFTKDNYFVIRKQGNKSQQNSNKLVPTGSGSVDWTDIRGSSFTETIKYAMKRELWEENGGQYISETIDKVGKTKILGFFRWLERGGKPEFVGITKLNCNFDAMEVDGEELINITNKSDMDTFFLDDIYSLKKVINDIRESGNISTPLSMCLDTLETYYENCPEELSEFLFNIK